MKIADWQQWHRRAGIIAVFFVVAICVTGLLLLMADRLELDRRYVQQSWLLDWYGMAADAPPASFPVDGNWITAIGGHVYLNGDDLQLVVEAPVGAVAAPGGIVVASASRLHHLDTDGRLIEVLDGVDGVPAGITAVGVDDGGAVIVRAGRRAYRVDLDAVTFEPVAVDAVRWSASAPAPAQETAVLARYRGRGLSMERVLLDLHSGRLFGAAGTWAVTLAGVLFLFMAASGAWLWIRRP